VIEKRFSQLKTDFRVAPVYLKDVSRIQSLLCVYFLVLLVEALLERELRQAMEREGLDSLPLYPEDRPCRRPTARRVIDLFDLFDDIQRHTLNSDEETPTVFVTELSDLQRRILKLLGVPATKYRA
jgi:transposase